MSPEELAGSVGEIQTKVLAKIQVDLYGLGLIEAGTALRTEKAAKHLNLWRPAQKLNPGRHRHYEKYNFISICTFYYGRRGLCRRPG